MSPSIMPSSILFVRATLASLLVAAIALTLVLLARQQPAPTIVVVPAPSVHVASSPAVALPSWCYGYAWRRSSVDLRPYCGWD